jgi:hypothetical protein
VNIAQEKTVDFKGYLKDVQTVSFSDNIDSITTGNYLYNRLMLRFLPFENLSAGIEARNRFFWGEIVKETPGFSEILEDENGLIDMSFTIADSKSLALNVNIDRLWINYQEKNFEARIGRQRINWGINLVWNPNDVFNTYNFLDFDYEERPGTDAIRFQYFTGMFSGLDLSISPGKTRQDMVAACRYSFNTRGFDFQFIGGVYKKNLTTGLGWAGSISDAGFKGEANFFYPYEDMKQNHGILSFSTSIDRSFSSGLYLNGSFLFSSDANDDINDFAGLGFQTLSPMQLMPATYSFYIQSTYMFTPLTSGTMSVIYCPIVDALIFYPSFFYSIAENWDVDLVAQSLWGEVDNDFKVIGNGIFLRLRWSF